MTLSRSPELREARRLISEDRRATAAQRKADRDARAPKPDALKRPKPTWGRVRDEKHLSMIRRLPCFLTLIRSGVEVYGCDAAHVRYSSQADGVVNPGKGVKPDDWRTVPLLRSRHEEQHSVGGEASFWRANGVENIYTVCRELHNVSGDLDAMKAVLRRWAKR